MYRTLAAFLAAAVLIGCGGTTSSRTPSPSPTPTIPSGGSNPAPATPSIVQVTAGQTAAGVNISVAPPSGTQPNIEDLGVAAQTGQASAFNTGDVIHRGTTMRVVVFGPGLTPDMNVSILGPNDIQISNVTGIMAEDKTPGVSFTAVVAPNAPIGARTVVLQSANGNMTTFTGGLEVVP